MSRQNLFEWLIAFSVLTGGVAWAQQPYYSGNPGQYGNAPVQYGPPEAYYASPDAYPQDPNGLYAELLPRDRGGAFDVDSRRNLNFREMLRGSWFRLEYLQGEIFRNSGTTLGEPSLFEEPNPTDPTLPPISVYDPDPAQQSPRLYTDGVTSGYGQVASTKGIDWHDAQGIRASVGIPILKAVWLEGSFLAYMNQSASLIIPPIPAVFPYSPDDPPVDEDGNPINPIGTGQGPNGTNVTSFLQTTFTRNGSLDNYAPLYDAGFTSQYVSRLKAGNIDLVFNWKVPEYGFRAQPILGYRHEQYSENLSYTGTFDNRSGYLDGQGIFSDPLFDSYNSGVTNQRDQFEIGMRNEIAFRYLTFGFQEKFGLGTNFVRGTVLYDTTFDPNTLVGAYSSTARDKQVVFAPSFDLDIYAKIRLTDWLNFRVGYNLLLMGNIATADQSIRYNLIDDGTTLTPDVYSKLTYGHRVVSALTIGGEIVLP